MFKKLIIGFAVMAVAAFAGTVPGAKTTFKITLADHVAVNGTEFKAGDCRVVLGEAKITLEQGAQSLVVPAKIENVESRFAATSVFYVPQGDKRALSEIRLGGTKTKITLP
jgi:hypothetical protein